MNLYKLSEGSWWELKARNSAVQLSAFIDFFVTIINKIIMVFVIMCKHHCVILIFQTVGISSITRLDLLVLKQFLVYRYSTQTEVAPYRIFC